MALPKTLAKTDNRMKFVKTVMAYSALVIMLTGCKSHLSTPSLFDRIKLGQSRESVEAIIGMKCYQYTDKGITTANYLDPPGLVITEGKPYSTIQVVYNNDGIVIGKKRMDLINQAM